MTRAFFLTGDITIDGRRGYPSGQKPRRDNPAQWLRDNAHIFIDADSDRTGSDADVASVVTDGLLGLTLDRMLFGSNAPVTHDGTGFRFTGGNYLRKAPVAGTFTGCLVVADVTLHSQASGVGYVAFVDNTPVETRVHLRTNTAGVLSGLGPGNNTADMAHSLGFGVRQTIGYLVDPENVAGLGVHGMIAADGYFDVDASPPGAFQDIVLDEFRTGYTADMTVHSLAVFFIPSGGSLPGPVYDSWAKVKGVTPRPVSATRAKVLIVNGQSLALGPSITPTEELVYNYTQRDFRRGVKMLTGLQRAGDNVAVYLNGPGLTGYNTTPATDVVPMAVDQNLTAAYSFSRAVFDQGGADQIWSGFVGAAGQPIANFLSGTTLDDNLQWWAAQIAAQASAKGITATVSAVFFQQGHADKGAAAGYWAGQMDLVWARHVTAAQLIEAGADPIPVILQDNGDANTIGDTWATCTDQLTWALANGGILVPTYNFEVADDSGHLTVAAQEQASETAAWALALGPAAWNIPAPAATIDGTDLTLTFALPTGRTLTAHDPAKYAAEGISHYGIEVDGATISAVSIGTNTITLTCSAAPQAVRYAMQAQNLTTRTKPHTAHRGELRTDLSTTAKGQTLHHWLPTFEIDLT